MRKQWLSFFTILLFAFLAVSSKGRNKLGMYGFNTQKPVEEASPKGDYVEEKDGTKHYGDNVRIQSGLLLKDLVKIGDAKIKTADVYGFRSGDRFYIATPEGFGQRVVRGTINVYQVEKQSTYGTSGNKVSVTYSYYAENRGDAKLTELRSGEDIRKLVADCPAALALASVKDKELRRGARKDRNYLNNIFEVYNRGCKE
jgi:hypothetical protein